MSDFMGWLLAWILLFLLLYVLGQTRAGHTLIYYWAWLLVALLIVTNGQQISNILNQGLGTGINSVTEL